MGRLIGDVWPWGAPQGQTSLMFGWLANTLRKPPSRSACLGVGRFVFVLCWVTCHQISH